MFLWLVPPNSSPLFSNSLHSSLVRIHPELLLLNIMSHLGEAPGICRFLEWSSAAKNYRPYTEKLSYEKNNMTLSFVFMPDPMLVRISPGDKILSGTEILMKQTAKVQRVTLDNSMNAVADFEETSTGWQTKRWPTPPGMNNRQTMQVIRPQNRQQRLQKEVAQINKTTLASIKVAVE